MQIPTPHEIDLNFATIFAVRGSHSVHFPHMIYKYLSKIQFKNLMLQSPKEKVDRSIYLHTEYESVEICTSSSELHSLLLFPIFSFSFPFLLVFPPFPFLAPSFLMPFLSALSFYVSISYPRYFSPFPQLPLFKTSGFSSCHPFSSVFFPFFSKPISSFSCIFFFFILSPPLPYSIFSSGSRAEFSCARAAVCFAAVMGTYGIKGLSHKIFKMVSESSMLNVFFCFTSDSFIYVTKTSLFFNSRLKGQGHEI